MPSEWSEEKNRIIEKLLEQMKNLKILELHGDPIGLNVGIFTNSNLEALKGLEKLKLKHSK